MKIGLDIRTLETGHKFRGIGVYTKNLLKFLSKLDKTNQYILFCQKNPGIKEIIDRGFQYQLIAPRKIKDADKYNWYCDQFYFPRSIKKSQVKLVHIFDQLSMPLVKTTKTILTVCDLMQIKMCHGITKLKNQIKIFPIHYADQIITISEFSKKEIINYFKIPQEKIVVTYLGYDQDVYNVQPIIQKELNQFKLNIFTNPTAKYFIYLGSYEEFEPRKNLDFLINVFAQYIDQFKYHDRYLVMIGKKGCESDRIHELADKLNISQYIKFVGFIPVEEIKIAFSNAEALLFPSLFEGFGLPVLEAMACGCPIISSNSSSLPEVIDKAGILLDPRNKTDWIKAMQSIANKNYRQELIKKGLIQAAHFSWEKCACQTLEIYQKVLNGKN